MEERKVIAENPSRVRERLRDYERLKLELASLIRRMALLVDRQADHEGYRKCQDLLSSLAADRFMLAVVGQFSRGKSSLMNAILGLERLPVGLVPLTSVITKVSYGNPERVLIEYRRGSLKGEIPLTELQEYVTEVGNPGNKKGIAAAEVQLPSDFLRRGLFFVDTPGIASAISANTATTEGFLPDADAVVFVTSFDSPLSREELEFLLKVREYVRKVFFVVNKLDLVPEEEREQVLIFIRNRLRAELALSDVRLFPVSALAALKAKISGSARQLAESGLPDLEESLVRFLTTDKTAEFLVRTCDRALSLLWELHTRSSSETVTTGRPKDGSGPTLATAGEPNVQKEAPDCAFAGLTARLARFRKELLEGSSGEEARSFTARLAARPRPEARLMEAARQPCAVCSQVAGAMFKYMAKFQYQILVSGDERSTLARRGGLCPLHTWQYAEIASPQGISTSYPDVLMNLSQQLRVLAESGPPGGLGAGTRSLVAGTERCCACREQYEIQERTIREILERLSAGPQPEANDLPVLCLPHLSILLRKVPDPALAQTLLEFAAALFERLAENMERYALKHDALRRELQSEDERVAYHRALCQLVGDKRLQAPWHVEYLL